MKRFAYGMIAGVVAFVAGLLAGYSALTIGWPSSLPAPAIGRLIHVDEKLRFLRDRPELDPRILAVGSSIAWRQLDGLAFGAAAGGRARFFNGATAFLKIHQTADLLDFYLAHFRHVDTVLILTNQEDFSDCTTLPAAMLDHGAAAEYAFGDWPSVYFYFRYFSPQRYLRAASSLVRRRRPLVGDLYLDAYGSGPVMVPASKERGLRYRPVDPDPACTDDLIALSHRLTARKLRLVVVFPPIHPDYRKAYPETVAWTERTVARLTAETAADKTLIVPLYDDPRFAAEDFYDAYHLQWPGAQRLSAIVAAIMAQPGTRKPAADGDSAVPIAEAAGDQSPQNKTSPHGTP
ncbi:MAG TPA: hypothetical protein VMV26_08665 [Alphaproteobacteria bacterium]|nr:hypothetical protein [Alphaproteobacteria bacterium]